MSWFHVLVYHGRGRQSKTQFYRWREEMTKGLMKDWRDELQETYGDPWDAGPAIITIRRVRALPADEHAAKVERCKDNIKATKALLKVLERTPILKEQLQRAAKGQ